MNEIVKAMGALSSAEEFFGYFGVPYTQSVVNVNRLHILKRFNQYLSQHCFSGVSPEEIRDEYRTLLERAYRDFVQSDAATEKVFKVFQEAGGVKTFSLDNLKASMSERRSA